MYSPSLIRRLAEGVVAAVLYQSGKVLQLVDDHVRIVDAEVRPVTPGAVVPGARAFPGDVVDRPDLPQAVARQGQRTEPLGAAMGT